MHLPMKLFEACHLLTGDRRTSVLCPTTKEIKWNQSIKIIKPESHTLDCRRMPNRKSPTTLRPAHSSPVSLPVSLPGSSSEDSSKIGRGGPSTVWPSIAGSTMISWLWAINVLSGWDDAVGPNYGEAVWPLLAMTSSLPAAITRTFPMKRNHAAQADTFWWSRSLGHLNPLQEQNVAPRMALENLRILTRPLDMGQSPCGAWGPAFERGRWISLCHTKVRLKSFKYSNTNHVASSTSCRLLWPRLRGTFGTCRFWKWHSGDKHQGKQPNNPVGKQKLDENIPTHREFSCVPQQIAWKKQPDFIAISNTCRPPRESHSFASQAPKRLYAALGMLDISKWKNRRIAFYVSCFPPIVASSIHQLLSDGLMEEENSFLLFEWICHIYLFPLTGMEENKLPNTCSKSSIP